VRFPRASGVLLHPTALPGPQPCGDLGTASHAFVDQLVAAGQRLWQLLPLGPTGFGDSPYQVYSAFAGNPHLISAERLRDAGLLAADLVARLPRPNGVASDFAASNSIASAIAGPLAEALGRAPHRDDVERFRTAEPWLDDYALFMALREAQGHREWIEWPEPLRQHDPAALAEARRALAEPIRRHEALQWAFARQWRELREHARTRGVELFGDAPIFVALDSADVWAHPELFLLDEHRQPLAVAGVPPDYFSVTGQRWGNPHYRWPAHAASDYAWWRERIRRLAARVDRVRLDHFIGFVRYWEIPVAAADAREGHWREGPGEALFRSIERDLGALPLVAEDLGLIGPDVEAVRDRLGLPGMRVLHFAYGDGPEHPFLPQNHVEHCVAYTGTHDNDTTLGWWASLDEKSRAFAREQLGLSSGDIAWDLIRAGLGSRADTFVIPIQDVLSLGSAARFNTPGRPSGNWTWRMPAGALTPELTARLRDVTAASGR
jgi:4-alpha-glucanotransferase